jgi:NAD(P)-dependent dehydrogenase (short-subunit alcohol dehydrogenase family)
LRLAQTLLPTLLAAPAPVIVNVSSRLGSLAALAAGDFADRKTSYAYRVSKAAQNMLTVALAQELAGRVRCWAVHPGSLATAMGGGRREHPSRGSSRPARAITRQQRHHLAALPLPGRARPSLVTTIRNHDRVQSRDDGQVARPRRFRAFRAPSVVFRPWLRLA